MFDNPIKRGRKEGSRTRCNYTVADGTTTDAEGNIVWSDGSGGGGSSYNFDWNQFATSITGAIPGILGGAGAILAAQNGNPVTYNANGQPVYAQQPQPQQRPTDYTVVYIILGVLLLLLVLGAGVYFLKK